MKEIVKDLLRPLIPKSILTKRRSKIQKIQLEEWHKSGCPSPPPHVVKQMTIADYQKEYNCDILVETGTFLGEMVEAQKNRFKQIVSIELSAKLFKNAVQKFRNVSNVKIVQGDSGEVLPMVLSEINEPAIFWLDGHYCAGISAKGKKECPIFEELEAIFNCASQYNNVILIDDARDFIGIGGYPTIDDLTSYVLNRNSNYQVEVKHDIIRFYTNYKKE